MRSIHNSLNSRMRGLLADIKGQGFADDSMELLFFRLNRAIVYLIGRKRI